MSASPIFRLSKYQGICPRCGRTFRFIDNLGTWQCFQAVPGADGVFVRADHIETLTRKVYDTPIDDFYFTQGYLLEMAQLDALIPWESRTKLPASSAVTRERMVYGDQVRVLRVDAQSQQAFLNDPMRTGLGYRLVVDHSLRRRGLVVLPLRP